jgi:ribosomal protein L7Ae-like RNA K-turn-binding protein
MSLKEISEAIEKGNICFGLKETLKNIKKSKAKKHKIFAANDAREETINKLNEFGIDFSKTKGKEELAKELNLDFECEVFFIK